MTVEATNNGWRSGWSRTCLPKLCVFNEFKNTNFKVELPMINEKQTNEGAGLQRPRSQDFGTAANSKTPRAYRCHRQDFENHDMRNGSAHPRAMLPPASPAESLDTKVPE